MAQKLFGAEASKSPPNPKDCKPTLRDGALSELTGSFRKAVSELHVDMFKTCITCINFKEHGEFSHPPQWCLRFSPQVGPVPARIVAYGCEDYWHDDEIPF